MRDAASGGGVRIFANPSCDSVELAVPRALAVTALRNLLDNALRHSPGPDSVSLTVQCQPEGLNFSVADAGPGMTDAEDRLATQRFWRRQAGRGSGLGLSIVAAIAQRFGGTLLLERGSLGGLTAHCRFHVPDSDIYARQIILALCRSSLYSPCSASRRIRIDWG